MKYTYNKNIKETDLSRPFLITMKKLDQIHETIKICQEIDDKHLIEELEAKQYRLIQRLTQGYNRYMGIKTPYSVNDLFDAGCLAYAFSQTNITSIEEQII